MDEEEEEGGGERRRKEEEEEEEEEEGGGEEGGRGREGKIRRRKRKSHTQTLTVHAARVVDVEAADDVADHDEGNTAVGDCHVQDARGKMEVWVLTLEDGDILGSALSATLREGGGWMSQVSRFYDHQTRLCIIYLTQG